MEEMIEDSRFVTNGARTENLKELIPTLDEIFITKNASEWIELLEQNGIPCGPINTIDKVMNDKQVLARNMIVEVEDKKAGKIRIAGNPIKMTTIPEKQTRKPAPEIGEHTKDVLLEYLNFNEKKISQLYENGVI